MKVKNLFETIDKMMADFAMVPGVVIPEGTSRADFIAFLEKCYE